MLNIIANGTRHDCIGCFFFDYKLGCKADCTLGESCDSVLHFGYGLSILAEYNASTDYRNVLMPLKSLIVVGYSHTK